MKTNYERALELLELARTGPAADEGRLVARAQVFATLAQVDAMRDRVGGSSW